VNQAREIQRKRYQEEAIYSNAALIPRLIEKYCKLDEESKKILEIALEKLGLSARAYGCILKVASVRLGTLV
jgi:magnesium chelatase family protein